MNIGGLGVGRLYDRDRLLRRAREATPTYDHVGSTLDPLRWSAPDVHSHHLSVGRGAQAFAAARTALRTWVPQRAIGADVMPPAQPVALDETVLLVLRRGPLYVVAPDRIVAVVDEPGRFAFAYGTLPGHPERGEESFTVERQLDDTVQATIRLQAGPGTITAQAAAPIVSRLQAVAPRRYLQAIADHVEAEAARRPRERREP